MTSDHAPTSGRPADSPALPSQEGLPDRVTPYRMTARTSLPFDDALARVDEALAAWLKDEGHDEPPPDRRSATAERFRLGDRILLDRDQGPLPALQPDTPLPAAAGIPAGPTAALAPPPLSAPSSPARHSPSEPPPGGGVHGRYARRRLRTSLPHGIQQLTLTLTGTGAGPAAAAGLHQVVLCLEAEQLGSAPTVRNPGRVPVPELVGTLLTLLDAWDGPAELAARPRRIDPPEVDDLIDSLCDPDRRLAAVVVSLPPVGDPDRWLAEQVQPALRQLIGVASLYVLSPAAQPLFNMALEYHKVYGGAVRTYLPEVDPASRADAARHHVLPRQRIEEDNRRAAALLAREPRRIAAGAALPAPLDAVPPLRLPPEVRRPVPARPRPVDEPSRPHTDEQRRRTGHRGARPAGRRCTGSGPVVLSAVAPEQLLGATLRAPAEAEFARLSADVAAEKYLVPGSFGELVERFEEFPLLEFTGDEKETIALDGQPDGAGWARLTWDGLTALQEYADAAVRGQAGGDFKQWCEHTPPGCHHFPPRKAVRWESRTVESHAKWKRERMLPVPSCVDVSRRVFMGAHLRIGGGSTAPRLHYLDDCSGSGRIYVGYIGQHLTNTRTN